MNLRPEEISSAIRAQIKQYKSQLEVWDVGTVIQAADGIVRIFGLEKAMQGELLEFSGGVYGMVMNLEENNVGAVLLGDDKGVSEGDTVRTTGRVAQVPVGDALIGRVVNALGQPIDGKGPVETDRFRKIERVAHGVIDRKSVDTPLQTGIKAIDSMIPIGRGQRELIIGDRQTGKTAIAVDTIINQKDQDVLCIYVAIGQKASTVASIVHTLESYGAMDYTTVVASTASELAPLQYIAPYAGCAMGEEWLESGKDVLIVYDFAAAQTAGAGGLPGGCFLSPFPFIGAGIQIIRRFRRRFADSPSHRGNPGGGCVCLYSHQYHFHNRWADLSGNGAFQCRFPTGGQCGAFRVPCGRSGSDRSHEKDRGSHTGGIGPIQRTPVFCPVWIGLGRIFQGKPGTGGADTGSVKTAPVSADASGKTGDHHLCRHSEVSSGYSGGGCPAL